MMEGNDLITGKPSIEIRLLTERDAIDFWRIRLRALLEEPSAFSASYEEAVSKPTDDIVALLREQWSMPDNYILGSFKNELLTGMVGFTREQRAKLKHKGNIWGMYIAPEARGYGVGRMLIAEVVRRSEALEGLEQIGLTVTSGNIPAKKLYENLGFRSYGVEKRALKIGLAYFDDVFMVLPIRTEFV